MYKINWLKWEQEDYVDFFLKVHKQFLPIDNFGQKVSSLRSLRFSKIDPAIIKILCKNYTKFFEENIFLIEKTKQYASDISLIVAKECEDSLGEPIDIESSQISSSVEINQNNKTLQRMLFFLKQNKQMYICPPLVLYTNNKYNVVDGNHRLALANIVKTPIKVQVLNNSVFGKCLLTNNKNHLDALVEASLLLTKSA